MYIFAASNKTFLSRSWCVVVIKEAIDRMEMDFSYLGWCPSRSYGMFRTGFNEHNDGMEI